MREKDGGEWVSGWDRKRSERREAIKIHKKYLDLIAKYMILVKEWFTKINVYVS